MKLRQEIHVMRSLAESLLDTRNRIERQLNPPPAKKNKGLSEADKAEFLAKYRKRKKAASGN